MIILEATYSKKLGLPNYSSHQYSVSIRTEIPDITAVEKTNKEMYSLLQEAVDAEITSTGYVPDGGYGISEQAPANTSNGYGEWACSQKQRELIEKIVADNHLDKKQVEDLAQQRFGTGVRSLNKMQASGLIEELLQTHGKNGKSTNGNGHRQYSRR